MRPIRFRVRNFFTGKWQYCNILDFEGIDTMGGLGWDRNSIGQFTGLHDKGGKEIYEGDIVRSEEYGVFRVVFEDGCFWHEADDRYGELHNVILTKCVVIGNIWGNEDLCSG